MSPRLQPQSVNSTPKLSLICPTFGRETLARLFPIVMPQLHSGDEFIVVGDGPCPNSRAMTEAAGARYLELPERMDDYGCSPCDHGIEQATGDFVFFVGDDDLTTPDAFEIIRAGVAVAPTQPHLFAMIHTGILFKDNLVNCLVSGQQIVVPRDMTKMPKMFHGRKSDGVDYSGSDWTFIEKVRTTWGKIVLHDGVICHLERQRRGQW